MEQSKVLIFLVEDEHLVRELLEHALVDNGFAVETAEAAKRQFKCSTLPELTIVLWSQT